MNVTDKINIDFQIIPTGDPKLLVVADTSVWGAIEDKPSIIEIKIPNSDKVVVHYFEKNKLNIFNTSNLLLSAVGTYNDLSDGIYSITVKGSPDSFCKSRDFLKDDKTKLEMYKLYISLGFDNDDKTKRLKAKLYELDMLIRAANANVILGKSPKGASILKRAMEDLKLYNNCNDCN